MHDRRKRSCSGRTSPSMSCYSFTRVMPSYFHCRIPLARFTCPIFVSSIGGFQWSHHVKFAPYYPADLNPESLASIGGVLVWVQKLIHLPFDLVSWDDPDQSPASPAPSATPSSSPSPSSTGHNHNDHHIWTGKCWRCRFERITDYLQGQAVLVHAHSFRSGYQSRCG